MSENMKKKSVQIYLASLDSVYSLKQCTASRDPSFYSASFPSPPPFMALLTLYTSICYAMVLCAATL